MSALNRRRVMPTIFSGERPSSCESRSWGQGLYFSEENRDSMLVSWERGTEQSTRTYDVYPISTGWRNGNTASFSGGEAE
jgi:hypothetical protein